MIWNSSPKLHYIRRLHRNRKFSLFSAPQVFEYIDGNQINPATIFAHTLESINAISGLGWPATIISFTLGMRLLILPSFIKQTKATIMANNLKDDVNKYQTRIQTFRANNQLIEARQELQEMYTFLRRNNCHPIRTIVLSLLPVPFFMSTFFALRNMARQPIESFLEGGTWWFSNLAESDPLFVLPVLSCVSLLASFEVSRKSNPSAIPVKMVNVLRLVSLVSIPVLAYMPSSLCLYFITTNIFTLMQNLIMSIPLVRSYLGIPKLLKPSTQIESSSKIMDNFREALNKFQAKKSNNIIIHSSKPAKLFK